MKEDAAKLIQQALKNIKIDIKIQDIEKIIEIPPNSDMGDFAFPCFFLVGRLKTNPHDIAIQIREEIGEINQTNFKDIQVSGPYINFFIDRNALTKNLIREILKKKLDFGKTYTGRGKKALIEHTSINPNAAPHVGRARNAIIGDSLVRILKFHGFNTETHYFVNDVSKQIAMLVLAKAEKMKFENMLQKYVNIASKVKKSKKLEKEVFDLLYKFEHNDKKVAAKFNSITKTCVEGQRKILSEMGIHYDVFDYESSYLSKTMDILEDLKTTGKLFEDKDGRMVLDMKGTKIQGQMKSPVLVLTRSDGTGLYPLRDLAYTIDKMKKSELNIIVLGEDQKLYFQQLEETLKLLHITPPSVVHYSFILLAKKGKSKKMSTRSGDVVLLEDFISEAIKKAQKKSKNKKIAEKVAIGAVKYAIIKNGPNKIINFNLDEALNFEGDTGPYLMYSYARASSIIKKSKKSLKDFEIGELEEKETELVKKLSEFSEVVHNSYKNLNPSLIANYALQLSQTFNEFYHTCKVIGSEEKESFRIALVESFRNVLKNALWLLGIETLEEM
ncbi:MAG: arginine--tRNA ligase [Candidatus Pacearchaeota archaeon]|jgi:arginyl-tRNA synthetase